MQIFEAAKESPNDTFDCPWYITSSSGEAGYLITRRPNLYIYEKYSGHDMYYRDFIEKQRGGVRVFKTIDSACRAVREIGQSTVEVIL